MLSGRFALRVQRGINITGKPENMKNIM